MTYLDAWARDSDDTDGLKGSALRTGLDEKFGDKGKNMKLTNLISFGAVVAMAAAPIAASQAQSIAASGSFMIMRDGKVVPAGTALASGDRVVTRGTSGAKLSFGNGCSVDVPAASTFVVDANSCNAAVKSLEVGRADYSMQDASSMKGAGWLVATLALAAAITGAAIAAGGTKHPTSP